MNAISQMDLEHLRIIREGVIAVQREQLLCLEDGARVLDVAPQDHAGVRALEGSDRLLIETLDIDPQSNATYIADITKSNDAIIPDQYFAAIFCTEVLEHVLNPFAAARELHRILKTGGRVIVTTPFNFRIHGPRPDCWRFTEDGLRVLFQDFSAVEISWTDTKDRWLMPVQYTTIAVK